MNYKDIMKRADNHHIKMLQIIRPLADKLRNFLEDGNADIFYQTDGWVIVYGYHAENTPIRCVDFKKLFKMTKEEAIEYLDKYSI